MVTVSLHSNKTIIKTGVTNQKIKSIKEITWPKLFTYTGVKEVGRWKVKLRS